MYLMLNNVDLSNYVNGIKVQKNRNYNTQTNAAGDTLVDYINTKREIEISFRYSSIEEMKIIQAELNKFFVTLSYLNPDTNTLSTFSGIVEDNEVEFFTIQQDRQFIKLKEFKVKVIEL